MTSNDTPATEVAKDQSDAVRSANESAFERATMTLCELVHNAAIEEAAVLVERDFDTHFTRELADMIRALKIKETK